MAKILKWLASDQNLPRGLTLMFGATGFMSAGVAFQQVQTDQRLALEQIRIASEESVKANVLRQIRLVESHEKQFKNKTNGYEQQHLKLVENPNYIGTCLHCFCSNFNYIGSTPDERRKYLDYASWMGRLDCADSVLTPEKLAENYGAKINLLVSNPFVFDQLLLQPKNYAQFTNLSKKVVEAQTNTDSHHAGYTRAKNFFDHYDKAVSECESVRKELRESRKNRELNGGSVVENKPYFVHCPYSIKFMELQRESKK